MSFLRKLVRGLFIDIDGIIPPAARRLDHP
jgi:hypothetical protein